MKNVVLLYFQLTLNNRNCIICLNLYFDACSRMTLIKRSDIHNSFCWIWLVNQVMRIEKPDFFLVSDIICPKEIECVVKLHSNTVCFLKKALASWTYTYIWIYIVLKRLGCSVAYELCLPILNKTLKCFKKFSMFWKDYPVMEDWVISS